MALNPKCIILGILGGKGGVGKSVFAANFAVTATQELRQPILLIDLDQRSRGDQNIITGLRPTKTVSELGTHTGLLNGTTIPQLLSRHASGFFFLSSVKTPTETMSLSQDLFAKMIDNLSQVFPMILIDMGSELGALQNSAMDMATALLVVTQPDVISVNQTNALINELSAASVPGDMVQLVINKVSQNSLPPQTVAQTLKRNLVGTIPQDDATVLGSVSRGVLFTAAAAQSPISLSFIDCFRRLTSGGLLQKLQAQKQQRPQKLSVVPATPAAAGDSRAAAIRGKTEKALDPQTQMKLAIHQALLQDQTLSRKITETKNDPTKEAELRTRTQQVISQIIDREFPDLSRADRQQITTDVLNEALGLGCLEALLSDETISEIMVNGREKIYIERGGRVVLSGQTFTSNLQLRNVIERIVSTVGRQINENQPYADARLKDGSRVNAVIEPVAIDGPSLTIRKFRKTAIVPQNYVEWNSISQSMLDFLRICVENRLNVVVSGGTGSGKTTLLNTLSGFIPASERIVTVEDAAELQLKQDHVVRLETRPKNMEGAGEITIRDLVRNALRMRPERIIVGECRGGEALDMLQAMTTGHDGSMTTTHANNPKEAIRRIETLCMMAGEKMPVEALREQICSAVDIIVQIQRLSDGSRKITHVTEVVGLQSDVPILNDIFLFREDSRDKNNRIVGQFVPKGNIPTFLEEFERRGLKVPRSLFSSAPPAGPEVKKASGGNS
ncbi:MAG: Flp pilus assembly complex ATPase component TadA [Bdellovibrionales bacterium]|nr:Flp pilus assembly complex ATPase component TadA [Bdellovibrionales bacterium]